MAQTLHPGTPREVAIPALLEQHGGKILALGRQFCSNAEEAEDVLQETFLQAWRKWDQFEGRSSPGTWLYTIASRVCQRMHRKRSGEPDRLEPLDGGDLFSEARIPVVPEEDDPLMEQIRREGREKVEEAIASLPESFRMPLVLREIVGFSLAEIGAILDLKEATVKTRLHRARMRVRDAVAESLPVAEVAPASYDREVCLDLLQSKQEHIDRGLDFEFPKGVVCERCAKVFETLDLASDTCASLAAGELPSEVREALLERLRQD
ncbi:MAG: sigma-70 family RNA polymerase sigma factor [Planctomycetes bacterium]|nr:sigma-70 family RNA polymerase sigma factor [Planctomycetota bacterium]